MFGIDYSRSMKGKKHKNTPLKEASFMKHVDVLAYMEEKKGTDLMKRPMHYDADVPAIKENDGLESPDY